MARYSIVNSFYGIWQLICAQGFVLRGCQRHLYWGKIWSLCGAFMICVCVCVCVCGEGGREGGEVVFDTMIFNSVILPHVVSRSEVWLDSYTSFLVCVLEDIPWWSKLHVSYFPFAALMVRAAKMYPKAILPSKLKTSRHAIAFWSSEKVWERIGNPYEN